ncbi:hypothetical protein PAAG_12054 [Paracoccidioides lutzii Pb01]|uniref:Uncharacterized protein n=1 Tax=Paracoccidioides lutzii (strain ATCC MYA-826 / Pb01) TaxID=502779 RepID=A0A0A2V1B9_PARBA|nr:hypothetical protein PAAG_12054 [Paracoccidioides lutzii Pb01]KGQ01283.1 hypothetical protein PAAG_12054 [Paracoccidioides lutzii Pb01]
MSRTVSAAAQPGQSSFVPSRVLEEAVSRFNYPAQFAGPPRILTFQPLEILLPFQPANDNTPDTTDPHILTDLSD